MDKLIGEFSFGLFFWQLLLFILLVFLLRIFAWKPILGAVNKREKSITDALASAEKAREEMAELKADNQKILKQAILEREAIVKEAKNTRDTIIDESKDKAKEEAHKIIANAKKNIENEKNLAIKEIKNQVAEISVQIAEKILKQELKDEKLQKDYINQLMKDVEIN